MRLSLTGFVVGLITVHRDEATERNYKLRGRGAGNVEIEHSYFATRSYLYCNKVHGTKAKLQGNSRLYINRYIRAIGKLR